MALKVRVFKSASMAYRELFSLRRDIFSIAWFPLLLIILFPLPFYLHEGLAEFSATYLQPMRYLGHVFENIIAAIFFVAIFRLIILKEKPNLRTFTIRRGVENEKILSVKFYFQFGKREALYAAASVLIVFLLVGLRDLYKKNKINQLIEGGVYDFSLLPWYDSIFYYAYFFMALTLLINALLLFVWPYLSVSDRVSASEIGNLIRTVWGNFLRLTIVLFLLYLPHDLLELVWFGFIPPNLFSFLPRDLGFLAPYFVHTFFTTLSFMCALAVVVFSSLWWNALHIKPKSESPAQGE